MLDILFLGQSMSLDQVARGIPTNASQVSTDDEAHGGQTQQMHEDMEGEDDDEGDKTRLIPGDASESAPAAA